jgi:acetylornithine deacetylase/succinyl-diaminopimelate desuccinylase-like protein
MVFLAHTDTVKPFVGAPYDQFAGEIHDGKVWGLGSTDMKSGVASMLCALKAVPDTNNVWLMLYADEEYGFLGMKHLVKEYRDIRPKVLISSDGSDLKLGYGCRGLIEFRMRVYGKTGHPARGEGNSAIWGSFKVLEKLQRYVSTFTHSTMGGTSFNLASVVGGGLLPDVSTSGYLLKTGQAGNVVPDVMEFVIDIRPASLELTAEKILNFLSQYLSDLGLKAEIIERTHNEGAWFSDIRSLSPYVEIAEQVTGKFPADLDDPGGSGYIDMQMLWNAVGQPPSCMFGGGVGSTAHTPNEHIEIAHLVKTFEFFERVLQIHS